MTDEHVWVTIGGKPLYVGQAIPEPKLPMPDPVKKPKRRQNPPPAPVEIFDAD